MDTGNKYQMSSLAGYIDLVELPSPILQSVSRLLDARRRVTRQEVLRHLWNLLRTAHDMIPLSVCEPLEAVSIII